MTEGKLLNEKQLENNIFQVDKAKKKGFKAFLNINSLPQLFSCLKSELSPLENSCLNEYELQNHLIELCFIPNKFTKFRTMKELILLEIRNNSKFWILNSDVYTQILLKNNQSEPTQSLPEEKNIEKISKIDTNVEGIESYLKYISKISTLKRKYTYIREHESLEETEYNKHQIEEEAENALKMEKIEEKTNKENDQELFEKFLQFNDTQRLTRHQKKRLYDDSNLSSQDLNKYINQKSILMRKKRDEEIQNSVFMPNRFLKHPKIEFQVFPYIFKFLLGKMAVDKEKQARKKFRMNQNLYSEGQKDHNGISQKNDEILKKNEDNLKKKEDDSLKKNDDSDENVKKNEDGGGSEEGLVSEFFKYCHNNGFLVENVFFNDHHFREKQNILLNNVLDLAKLYLKQKEEGLSLKEAPQISESDHIFYQGILEELENYETLEENLSAKLVEFFIYEIENKKSDLESNDETIHQFLYLNENFQKDNAKNVMGSFSSFEKINETIQIYEEMINSPTMKKKRAYKFHSEERGEWTENIYRKFLEGLLKFYDNSINNKKIAKFIGSSISANHVKFVKGKYLRRLKKRSKDLRIVVKDLLMQDIENFNMKIFEFISQNTKKN